MMPNTHTVSGVKRKRQSRRRDGTGSKAIPNNRKKEERPQDGDKGTKGGNNISEKESVGII